MAEEAKTTQTQEPEESLPLYPLEAGLGSVSIREDVLARIAFRAVADIKGVSLVGKFSFSDLLPATKEAVKGIQVIKNPENGRHSILLEVRMAYGVSMNEVATRLQRHVKDTVEAMANISLERVDVQIVDIFDRKEREELE